SRQCLAIDRRELTPSGVVARQLAPLASSESRMQLVEAIVIAMRHDVVPHRVPTVPIPRETRHAVRSQQTQALREIGSIGDDEAAFTHRHVLVAEEGEAADVADSAGLSAVRRPSARIEVTRADRMARVFDKCQTMACAEL